MNKKMGFLVFLFIGICMVSVHSSAKAPKPSLSVLDYNQHKGSKYTIEITKSMTKAVVRCKTNCKVRGVSVILDGDGDYEEKELKKKKKTKITKRFVFRELEVGSYTIAAKSWTKKNGKVIYGKKRKIRLTIKKVKADPTYKENSNSDPTYPEFPYNNDNYETKMLNQINVWRKRAGLNELKLHPTVHKIAVQRAKEEYLNYNNNKNYLPHRRPDGRMCLTLYDDWGITDIWGTGENLAWGDTKDNGCCRIAYSKWRKEIFSAYLNSEFVLCNENSWEILLIRWMESEGHRKNLMNSTAKYFGAAYYTDKNGETYWIQELADDN